MKRVIVLLLAFSLLAVPAFSQIEVGPRIVWGANSVTSASLDIKFVLGALSISGYAQGEKLNAVLGIAPIAFGEKSFGAQFKVLGGVSLDPNANANERITWGFGGGIDLLILPFGTRFYADNLFVFKPNNAIEYQPSIGVSFDILRLLIQVAQSVSPTSNNK